MIPSALTNVYLLGYTRPLTGGLSNITEMQSLLIHRLITDEPFRSDMADRLDEKIKRHNRKYYTTVAPGPVRLRQSARDPIPVVPMSVVSARV